MKRCGLPVFVKKHRFRVGFAGGLLIYVALLLFLSSFVWNVRVEGNVEIPSSEIIAVCRELGLKEGAWRSDIDPNLLRTKLALRFDNIAWASVNIEGVRATVNVSESERLREPQKPNCNFVAEFDGVITDLRVTEGTIKVAVGQTVQKGELLVSGITEYKDGTVSFGRSEGEVLAITERELECFVPFSQTETVRSSTPKIRRAISFFGVKIPLYLGSVKGSYETETKSTKFEKYGMYLPVVLTETAFFHTHTEQFVLTTEQACQKAEQILSSTEQTDLQNAEILEKSVEFEVTSDGIRATGKYKCKQNIAKMDLLLILEEK